MALTSILRIVHAASPRATAPRHSQYLLYSALVLAALHLSIGTLLGSSQSGGSNRLASASTPSHLLTSPTYGSEVFNLIVFHEVIRSNETLYSLHAKVVDSCIDIIVSRPVPMVIEIDRTKWEAPRNHLSPRHHSAEKQLAIRTQINKLWSSASSRNCRSAPTGDGQWRLTLDLPSSTL